MSASSSEVSSWTTGCQRAKAGGSKKFTLRSRATWPEWQEAPGSHLFPPVGSGRAGLSHTHYFKQEMDDDLLNGYPEEQLWFVRISSADQQSRSPFQLLRGRPCSGHGGSLTWSRESGHSLQPREQQSCPGCSGSLTWSWESGHACQPGEQNLQHQVML